MEIQNWEQVAIIPNHKGHISNITFYTYTLGSGNTEEVRREGQSGSGGQDGCSTVFC